MDLPPDPADVALLEGAKLIAPPPPLPADEDAAVAVWQDGDCGAILSIWHDPDDDEEPFSQDITTFRRVGGVWRSHGSAGSDWPVAYGERPTTGRTVFTGLASGTMGGPLWLVSGIAPRSVRRVRVQLEAFETETDVEPVSGAFLVALPTYSPPWDSVTAVT